MNPTFPERPTVSLEQARAFLQERVKSELVANIMGALFSLIGAAFVFGGIIFFSFLVSVNLGKGYASHSWIWISLAVSLFAFLTYAWSDSETLSRLEVHTLDGRPAYNIPLPGGMRLSNVNYLSRKTQAAIARILLQFIVAGPRALFAARSYVQRAMAIRKIKPESIASPFKLLVERGRRVPYEELAGTILRDPEQAFADILLLDLAQHLESPPPGMVVTSRCREKVTGIRSDGMDF